MNRDIQTVRAFDAQVSEVVFGIKTEYRHWFSGAVRNYDYMNDIHEIIPAYSTTWEGMKLVVEEMKRKGWSFTLQCWGDEEQIEEMPYEATFGFLGSEPTATANTAPHAVCLAALKALEGNV